jgi:LmbE family N-acetylglucosaminyl deacetylase
MIDVLAVSAHPDDIEAGCGGLLLHAHYNGLQTASLSAHEANPADFASAETRMAEAEAGQKRCTWIIFNS